MAVYFVQDSLTLNIKIGFTAANPQRRLRELQTGNSSILVLLAVVAGDSDDEHRLHQRFARSRLSGEWFKPTPDLLSFILKSPPLISPEFPTSDSANLFSGEGGSYGENTYLLVCPACGNNYVHPCGQHEDSDQSLCFTCEAGHHWSLDFADQKGFVFVTVGGGLPPQPGEGACNG